MSLGDGLPELRSDWPPEVLAAARRFTCGDVVESPPYFYFADPKYPVMSRTKDYADGYQGPEVIDASELAAPYGVITTQTCDVGEVDFDPPSFPFISVSPVFDGTDLISGGTRKLLRKGKRIRSFLHIPLLSDSQAGFWVADFRLEMPVEKSWLVGRDPIQGFASEEGARKIPSVLHDLKSRPAWAAVVNECLEATLRRLLDDLRRDDRSGYELVLEEIDLVGVRADSMLEPTLVTLAAFSDDKKISESTRAWWTQASSTIADLLEDRGVAASPAQTYDLSTCPVSTFRQYSPVSLGGKYSPG